MLAHRFVTGAGGCRLLGHAMLGQPTPRLCLAGQGRCRAREWVLPAAMPSGQPSSHTGQRGLTCAMAPRLLAGHKFSTEQGNLGGFQIPLHCLPLRTMLGCVRRKTIPDLPESQLGCAARLSPKRDFGTSCRRSPVSSSKGDPAGFEAPPRAGGRGQEGAQGACVGCRHPPRPKARQ